MKQPKIGQVLVTKSGEQFKVEHVHSTYEPDEPNSNPNGFAVFLAAFNGINGPASNWQEDLLDTEFHKWCESNGVSF